MKQIKNSILLTFTLIAVIILLDFVLPGKENKTVINTINTAHQSYYNAGGNSHISYKITTNQTSFNVSKTFADTVKKDEDIYYTNSVIFNQVNTIKNQNKSQSEIYSLRLFSGLALPLIALVILGFYFILKKSNEFLLIICSISIIANLIYILI